MRKKGSMASGLLSGVLSLVLGVILIVNVVMPTVKDANTTSWSSSEIAIYGLVGIVVIFGLIYAAASIFGVL